MTKKRAVTKDIELEPDAWARFEQFVRDIAKAGPQHRISSKPKGKPNRSPTNRKAAKHPRAKQES